VPEYQIRLPQVVHETVDGEVVAIDFTTGSYYSLRGPAEAAWGALASGEPRSPEEIAEAVEERCGGPSDLDRVGSFLDRLVNEGLLERTGPATGSPDVDPGDLDFEKFSDMEELILLDPVHDVSEAGWPTTAS
jgi:hypothetical protein